MQTEVTNALSCSYLRQITAQNIPLYNVTLSYLVCPDVLSTVGETCYGIRAGFIQSHRVFTICFCICRISSNIIRTSFCRFLKRKKKLLRGPNPHQWEDDGEDKDDSDRVTDNDSVMSDDGESDEE